MKRTFLVCIVAVAALILATQVGAWGQHYKIAAEVASCTSNCWQYSDLSNQADWADGPSHTTGSTYYYDKEYNHHTCAGFGDMAHFTKATNGSGCGTDAGNGPDNAGGFFNKASYYNSIGARSTAIMVLGRGQHYIQDATNPYHTTILDAYGSMNCQALYHTSYENYVASNFYSKNFYQDVDSGAYSARGTSWSTDKATITRSAANTSYGVYWKGIGGDLIAVCLGANSDADKDKYAHKYMYWAGYYTYAFYYPVCS